MERLDTYHPSEAREQTRIIELVVEPTEDPRPLALVESYPEAPDEPGDRAAIEVFDLEDRKVRAVAEIEFEGPEGGVRAVRSHPNSPPGLDAALLEAVVEGLVAEGDWAEQLTDHLRQFRDASHKYHEADLPDPADFEDVGRNEPCPCGSGLKHKKCCLRRRRDPDVPQPHDHDLDDFLQSWRSVEPDRPEGINQLLEALWSVLAVGGNAEKLSLRLLEDVGIEIRDDEIEEAARAAETINDFPAYWREYFREEWTWQAPLLEVVLPVVAEILWEARIPDEPRPHRVKSCIQGGYDSDLGTDVVWQRWYRAFDQLRAWVEGRDIEDDDLVDRLDEVLQLWEGVEQWVVDLLELARQRADEDTPIPTEVTDQALEVFEAVGSMFEIAAPGLANDADVFRYAALTDIEEYDRAGRVLDEIADKPVADEHAALYLGDLFVRWGFEAPNEHLERIVGLADRSLEEFDEGELDEVRRIRDELTAMLEGD